MIVRRRHRRLHWAEEPRTSLGRKLSRGRQSLATCWGFEVQGTGGFKVGKAAQRGRYCDVAGVANLSQQPDGSNNVFRQV